MLHTMLRNRRRSAPQAVAKRPVSLQPLMAPERDLAALQRSLDEVGRRLNVNFHLQPGAGEIVLLDGALLPHLSIQQLEAFREDRPAVTVPNLLGQPMLGTDELVQASLLQQFEALQLVDRRGSASNTGTAWHSATSMSLSGLPQPTSYCPPAGLFSVGPVSEPVPDKQALGEQISAVDLIEEIFLALAAASNGSASAAKSWGYAAQANLFFDFRRGQVVCDQQALQRLRVRFELPHLIAREGPRFDACRRSMDEVLWDLGMASAALPLRNAPENWIDAPFVYVSCADIRVLTRQPSHLEAIRRLQADQMSATALRRSMRFTQLELKQFMQALSFLGRLRWVSN